MLSPDATAVAALLDAARRRLDRLSLLTGATVGLALAAALTLVGWPVRGGLAALGLLGACAMAVGAARWWLQGRTTRRSAAARLEAQAPQARNLLITATELLAGGPVEPYVAALVFRQAAAFSSTIALPTLLPSRRALQRFGAAAVLWAGAIAWRSTAAVESAALAATSGPPSISDVTVIVTPPAYLGLAPRTLRNPARIEAIAGSHVVLTVRARATTLELETLDARVPMARRGEEFVGETEVSVDGLLALQPAAIDGQRGDRRMIGVTAVEDRPPVVAVRTPGRDLHYPDAARKVTVTIEANDDYGLASLRLRATTVSGSGERFSFAERDVPIAIVRQGPGRWTASTTWQLATLGLEPGDMVVYRAVATDRRPGAPPVESDAWIVEITAPGSLAASGFAIDPEQDRYALSQQMVILKTERLLAGKGRLSAEAFADSAAQIGMEQRRVRAEFVFMMGGEVDDGHGHGEEISQTELNEVAEAEGEDELAAGRLQNAGRLALVRGIRNMSRAATLLGTDDVPGALREERKALAEIEQAFSHSRIILRALTQRESLDPARRLTGSLADAASSTDDRRIPTSDAKAAATRRLLAELSALPLAPPAGAVSALAEAALRIDPADKALQLVAAGLVEAAAALRRGATTVGSQGLDRVATRLAALIGSDAPRAAGGAGGAEVRRLRGRLADGARPPAPRLR